MPTGYTSNLYEGKPESFEDFVLTASRAMGAFVMQRDNPSSEPPLLREVESYYFKRVSQAEAELTAWNLKTDDDKYEEWREYATGEEERIAKRKAERQAMAVRYNSRLAEVRAWVVPELLQSFKDFMIEQIEQSIEFDCTGYERYDRVVEFENWLTSHEEILVRSVEMASDSLDKEVERVKSQNVYCYALYNALGLEYNE